MFSFLTVLEGNLVISAVSLAVGVFASTKIKDWFKGIPADLRTALNGVEKTTIANVKEAQTKVIATLPQPPVKPAAPAVPAAQVVTGPIGVTGATGA